MDTSNIKITYPRNDEFEYYVKMERIDLDKECQKDLSNQHGFIIKEPQQINKALKSEDSIFSSKFGRSLQDRDPYSNRYSCKYGCTQGAFYAVPHDANWVCPICGTEIKLVGDDFTYFGWIKLKDKYCVIHPMMYQSLAFLIGKDNLEIIIEPEIELDTNGNPMSNYDKRLLKKRNTRKYKRKSTLDTKYAGIGMLAFRDNFDEIINYFFHKKTAKREIYEDIMKNRDIIFIHSIPVYTTQLRIAKVENRRFTFESTNADFNILAKLAAMINKDHLSIYRNSKYQNKLLWDMQSKISSLTDEIISILSGKKGVMRSTISGRTAFSERSVIVPNAMLKMDEITLPYFGLALLMEQVIINILQKSYNITYAQAYKLWYYATLQVDQRVLDIINNLIKIGKVRVLINRNPTIFYQSIVYKRVVGCTLDYVMGMDVYTLDGLTADFDGDTLNIKMLYNEKFADECEKVYSPRNAFCISRNDGRMNPSINIFKDTVINLNALINLSKEYYTEENKSRINALQEKYKNVI
jgi:DNA-directed RNA polymerase beta' subunit